MSIDTEGISRHLRAPAHFAFSIRVMNDTEILAWIADLFEVDPASIRTDTPRSEVPAWDSLGVLTLMAALDEKFNVVTTDEDMRAMKKVGDILILLKKCGKLV